MSPFFWDTLYIKYPLVILEPPLIDLELPQRYRPTTIKGLCEATGLDKLKC